MSSMDCNLTLFDIFDILWKKKLLVMTFALIFTVSAAAYCLLTPNIYRAESLIIPASQGGDKGAAMMAQLGGFASFLGGGFGGRTRGDLLIGILQSTTIVDQVIERFNLMELYDTTPRLKVRESVRKILDAKEDISSGIIAVASETEDPEKAAEMANFFVETLQNRMRSLSVGEAAQRRAFFEDQMKQAFKALGEAEDEMMRYQEQSGMVAMEPQLKALFDSITALRAQIAAKEVEISGLRTYARRDNPNLKLAQSQLTAMRGELAKLEEQQRRQDVASGDLFSSVRQAPHIGLEYQRRMRDLKFAEVMYELMLKQFEAAKLDEANEVIVVQVIDPAIPPDYKFRPRRARILVVATLAGFFFGIFWVLWGHFWRALKEDIKRQREIEHRESNLLE